VTDRDHRVWN